MDLLPSELKQEICLHTRCVSIRDLASLSFTCRAWRQISLPLLFEGFRITYRNSSSTGTLKHLVTNLHQAAGPLPILKFVKRLEFSCLQDNLGYSKEKQRLGEIREWGPYVARHYYKAAPHNKFLEPHLQDLFSARPLIFHEEDLGIVGDQDWESLILLISFCVKLEKFTYYALSPFSNPLYDAVIRHRPSCQLNIMGPQPLDTELESWTGKPHLLHFLYSDNLHTLTVRFPCSVHPWHYGGVGDYSTELLPFLFTLPNLKNLILEPAASDLPLEVFRRKWRKAANLIKPVPAAHLDSLTLMGWGPWENVIYDLANAVDVSSIRSLEIPLQQDDTLFAPVTPRLTNLERLFVTLGRGGESGRIGATDPGNTISALLAIPPLRYLAIRGLRDIHNLRLLLKWHGNTLQGLILEPDCPPWSCEPIAQGPGGDLYPVLESSDIESIAQACPNLQEIRLQLRRHQGSSHECKTYRAFRHFQSLTSLILDLDCEPRERPVNRDLHTTKITAIIRSAFINAATDEALVRGIWSLIANPNLRTLRVAPFGYLDLPRTSHDIFRIIAKPFILTRVPGELEPAVEEIAQLAGNIWTDNSQKPNWRQYVYPQARRIYQQIWPPIGNDGDDDDDDWVRNWRSFPLAASDGLKIDQRLKLSTIGKRARRAICDMGSWASNNAWRR